MSARLDQSLDSIIDTRKKAQRDARRRTKPGKPAAVAAPVGGVKKLRKATKPAVKLAPAAKSKGSQGSKIVVSGLPVDVNEAQIKEYFSKAVGAVKIVSLSYDREGRSQGKAEITFVKSESAAEAAKSQNGVKVDNKPMKIDVVVNARDIPEPVPAKSLTERVTYGNKKPSKSAPLTRDSANPKAQPKSAVAKKATDNKKAKAKKPNRKTNKPKPKTKDELDAEMVDYFGPNNNNAGAEASAAVAAPATGDDMGMEEIS